VNGRVVQIRVSNGGVPSLAMRFLCDHTPPATQIPGVNNLFITASSSPVPDTIALMAKHGITRREPLRLSRRARCRKRMGYAQDHAGQCPHQGDVPTQLRHVW